ncbi:MAG: hypothetical protein IKG21_11670, partial [Atopobiaceae bacterium]|nr:hypothetical protein [Atopobiaceae bacterium]
MRVTQTMRRWSRRASVFALSFAMVSGTVPASAMEQIASEAEAQAADAVALDEHANASDASEDELVAQLANDVSNQAGEDQVRRAEELRVRLASAAAGVAEKTDAAASLLELEKTQYESDSEAVAQAYALVAQSMGIVCEVQGLDDEGTYQNLITIDGVAYTLNASLLDESGAIRVVEQVVEDDEEPVRDERAADESESDEQPEAAEATESGESAGAEVDDAEPAEAQSKESGTSERAAEKSAEREAVSASAADAATGATSAATPAPAAADKSAAEKVVSSTTKAAPGLGAQADSTQADTKADLSKATVAKVADQLYTGKAVKPEPKVTLAGKTLRKGTDYALSYKNNTKVGTATVTATGTGDYSGTVSRTFKIVRPAVSYAVHVQGIGDQSWRKDGKSAGTFGESRRLESIKVKLSSTAGVSGGIEYRTHVQGIGWEKSWAADGAESGTRGQSRRLEAIQMRLTGDLAKAYDVYYRVHAQNVGWMSWAKNGAKSGTAGMSWRLEAIQVLLVPKGQAAPSKVDGVTPATKLAMLENPGVTYHTHVQTYGWMDWVGDGELSGTSGESKRLEALEAKLGSNKVPGSIRYAVHVQSYGWQDV